MSSKAASRALKTIPFSVANALEHGPRVGVLSPDGRLPIDTPHYLPVSSRGAVPHISQDNLRRHTSVSGIYTALEDYIEKAPWQTPPIYGFRAASDDSALRKFIALQTDALLVLGPRRIPPLACPAGSTSTSISIMTNLGFSTLECGEYVEAAQKLRPDVVIAMGDVLYGHQPGVKRAEKMGDRTQSWLNALVNGMKDAELGNFNTAVFAPMLPIDAEKQSWYLSALQDDFRNDISGLVFYEIQSAFEVPRSLKSLPRLWLGAVTGPLEILNQVAAGIDLFTIPFLNDVTDAGIALDFAFGPNQGTAQRPLAPLGLDLWSNSFAVDVTPLRKDCTCYTCTNHHRAYVHHLLDAKEMLAWVLLQLHNCAIMDAFFAAVRKSVSRGTFEQDTAGFEAYYERQLPIKTGQGPRTRGYQFKSEGKGEPKKNPAVYRSLDDRKARLAEAVRPSEKMEAADLEQVGFAAMFDEAEGDEGRKGD